MAAITLFPLQFLRQDATPIDIDETFATTADRITYLTNPRRYSGQLVSDNQLGAPFMLNNARTAWLPIGTSISEPNTQVVYGTGSGVSSSSSFYYNNTTKALGVNPTHPLVATPGTIDIHAAGSNATGIAGASIYVSAGDGNSTDGTSDAGLIEMRAGDAEAKGGDFYVRGGNGLESFTGDGGNLYLWAGNGGDATGSFGGNVELVAGDGDKGGDVFIQTGSPQDLAGKIDIKSTNVDIALVGDKSVGETQHIKFHTHYISGGNDYYWFINKRGALGFNTTDSSTGANYGTSGQVLVSAGATGLPSWGGGALEILDEGSSLTAAATSINFVGAGVVATTVVDAVTVTIDGGLSHGGGNLPTNAAGGTNALVSNTTGIRNTALGVDALTANTTRDQNTAVGWRALYSQDAGGNDNVAVGTNSLFANTIGTYNSCLGNDTMLANTEGSYNTALGISCLNNNTKGNENVGIGDNALFWNTTGNSNLAMGEYAVYYSTNGSYNTGLGESAATTFVNGQNNTAIGAYALTAMVNDTAVTAGSFVVGYEYSIDTAGTTDFTLIGSGDSLPGTIFVATGVGTGTGTAIRTINNNTGLGYNAGSALTTGQNNVFLGANAGNDALISVTTQDNQVVVGNDLTTDATIKVAWTVVSDARDKTSFAPVPHGLDFVNSLKPTAYRYVDSRESNTPTGPVRYGFKAQDILFVEGNNSVIIDSSDKEKLKLRESSLIAVLVQAIQELSAE